MEQEVEWEEDTWTEMMEDAAVAWGGLEGEAYEKARREAIVKHRGQLLGFTTSFFTGTMAIVAEAGRLHRVPYKKIRVVPDAQRKA